MSTRKSFHPHPLHQCLTMLATALIIVSMLTSCMHPDQGARERTSEYDDDGYHGLTNTNPNMQTSPSFHTYTEDRKLIRQTLRKFPEARHPRIVLNGARATIFFNVDKRFDTYELEMLETALIDALRTQVPRYDFVLRSQIDS